MSEQQQQITQYCAFQIFPKLYHPADSGLAANVYIKLACNLLAIANEFCRTCGARIEVEPWSLADISEGRPPAPISNRVYRHINGGRTGEGLFIYQEPGEKDRVVYCEYFGNALSDGSITILVPLDNAYQQLNYDDHSIFIHQDAANAARNALRQLPAARIEETFLNLGLAEDRHTWKLRTLRQSEANPRWDD
jgi:hypothetical protein